MTDADQHLLSQIEAHAFLFRGRPPTLDRRRPARRYAMVDQSCSDITTALGIGAFACFEDQ